MFLYTFIFLVLGFSYAAAQADSSRRDSVGRYEAETVIVERDRDKHLVTPLVLNVDLRETEQIAASSSLSQVLPLLHSSFDVRSYGTLGGISLPTFRGLPSEYINVYRNGIRLTNAQHSLTDLERYTSRASSKVSILSSTESAAYTSGVAGASVLIESMPALNDRIYTAGVALQSYEMRALNDKEYYLRVQESLGAFGVNFSGSYRTADGAFPFYQRTTRSTIERENNDAYLAMMEIEPTYEISEDSRIRGLATYSQAERGVPGANTVDFRGASNPNTRQYDEDWLTGLFYQSKVSDDFYHEASASYQSQYETYRDHVRNIDDAYKNRIAAVAYRASIFSASALSFFGDLGYERDMLTSNQHEAAGDVFRDQYYLSTAAKYLFSEDLGVSGSLRIENVSDFDELQLLPAASLSYTYDELTLSASFGTFYHAPTFNQLYWRLGGDSTLQPEKGESYEVRASYPWRLGANSSLTAHIAGFFTDIRDQIIWTLGSGGYSIPVQMQRVQTRGVEVDIRFAHNFESGDAASLRLASTFLDKVNLVESSHYYGKELPYSAPIRLHGILSYEWKEALTLTSIFWHRAQRYSDFANNPSGKLPSVTSIDFHLRMAPVQFSGIALVPQISLINATNAQYEDVLSYPLPGRIFKLSVDFTYEPYLP